MLAHIAPHSRVEAAVGLLVLVFLVVEIPLIFSIFRGGCSKNKNSEDKDE